MTGKERFEQHLKRHPHAHRPVAAKPHLSRRMFFQLAGSGLLCSYLPDRALAQSAPRITTNYEVTPINRAKNVIFILLTGAPSHTDTFDFKQSVDSPLDLLKPDTVNGIAWPFGILPNLGQATKEFTIVRSVRAWALVHSLAQTWSQIGRSPAGVLGDVAPNIGSVVALEKAGERGADQVFPTFLALNSDSGVGSGYFSSSYAPFRVTPAAAGIRNTSNPSDPNGTGRFAERWALLRNLDGSLRRDGALGKGPSDMDAFYESAKGMMYNPAVNEAFSFTAEKSARYGSTGFGNACLVASQVLAANQGTRFVQISYGSWDHHVGIYTPMENDQGRAKLPGMAKTLDDGLSALLADLKASGALDETLIVMTGEFGRTVGALTSSAGRDHHVQQFAFFAGAGVVGGRVIGATDATGAAVVESGWSRQREIRPEDIEATIYSAMGINWTTVRYDDPFGRGFYYVPDSDSDVYGPINELWAS
ncbi:DUF1501 domain-containing protein [uncultured Paludibaculum sp.]|uniref:DUF1501 domain-containing protein n=1 Tax=uncultured Paludibaculum sp. TaxID=1765020 RepID=UPI002AAAA603|nr:DUF1501 domain-containing protein [uncultured Paludibaculum sp.]